MRGPSLQGFGSWRPARRPAQRRCHSLPGAWLRMATQRRHRRVPVAGQDRGAAHERGSCREVQSASASAPGANPSAQHGGPIDCDAVPEESVKGGDMQARRASADSARARARAGGGGRGRGRHGAQGRRGRRRRRGRPGRAAGARAARRRHRAARAAQRRRSGGQRRERGRAGAGAHARRAGRAAQRGRGAQDAPRRQRGLLPGARTPPMRATLHSPGLFSSPNRLAFMHSLIHAHGVLSEQRRAAKEPERAPGAHAGHTPRARPAAGGAPRQRLPEPRRQACWARRARARSSGGRRPGAAAPRRRRCRTAWLPYR